MLRLAYLRGHNSMKIDRLWRYSEISLSWELMRLTRPEGLYPEVSRRTHSRYFWLPDGMDPRGKLPTDFADHESLPKPPKEGKDSTKQEE